MTYFLSGGGGACDDEVGLGVIPTQCLSFPSSRSRSEFPVPPTHSNPLPHGHPFRYILRLRSKRSVSQTSPFCAIGWQIPSTSDTRSLDRRTQHSPSSHPALFNTEQIAPSFPYVPVIIMKTAILEIIADFILRLSKAKNHFGNSQVLKILISK